MQHDIEGRYHRQKLIKKWSQDKIRNSTVFIAGMGALGCPIAANLAMIGIGKIIMADYDTIELSNLARQFLFTDDDIGKNKVIVAKEKLSQLNPEVEVLAINDKIQNIGENVYESCDLIISSLDTFEARRWLNSICVYLKKTWIDGGIYEFWGNVQVITPDSACLECQPLVPEERLQQVCTLPGEERKKEEEEVQAPIIPSVASVSAVIGGIIVQETLNLLLNLHKPLSYLFYDGISQTFTKIELKKRHDCFICSEKYKIEGQEIGLSQEEQIKELKNRLTIMYGFQDPTVMHEGIILFDDLKVKDIGIKDNSLLFVWDLSIARPLKLISKII